MTFHKQVQIVSWLTNQTEISREIGFLEQVFGNYARDKVHIFWKWKKLLLIEAGLFFDSPFIFIYDSICVLFSYTKDKLKSGIAVNSVWWVHVNDMMVA